MTKEDTKTLKIKVTALEDGETNVEMLGGNQKEIDSFILSNARSLFECIDSNYPLFENILENNYEKLGYKYVLDDDPNLVSLLLLNVSSYFSDESKMLRELMLPVPLSGEIVATNLEFNGESLDVSKKTTFSIELDRNEEETSLYNIYNFYLSVIHNELLSILITELKVLLSVDEDFKYNQEKINESFFKVIDSSNEGFSHLLFIIIYKELLKTATEKLGTGYFLNNI